MGYDSDTALLACVRLILIPELENAVKLVNRDRDGMYFFDEDGHKAQNNARPWKDKSRPNYFQHVRISAVALVKMVMHTRAGGQLEVMGLMQGYVAGDSLVVTDALRLPVEGTETRVNAQEEANEYMVNFLDSARQSGQLENAVGWYHSHPGYGCWLSGIDVSTQHTQQMFSDPFVAVVIDPDRTISAGKVEIGAFRTYPEDYKPEGQGETDSDGFQAVPLAKMEDFGAHSARYYSLEVSHFKSTLDAKILEALWNKYWVNTVSSSPLFTNRDYGTKQMAELALKIKQAERSASSFGRPNMGGLERHDKKDEQLSKIVRAGNKITNEEETGLLAAEIKQKLFNGLGSQVPAS